MSDLEQLKSNRRSGIRLTDSHNHSNAHTNTNISTSTNVNDSESQAQSQLRKRSSKTLNFVDLEKIVGLVYVYERQDRTDKPLDLYKFEHISPSPPVSPSVPGVLSFHSDVCFYMNTSAAYTLCSELIENPLSVTATNTNSNTNSTSGSNTISTISSALKDRSNPNMLIHFPLHCILHYIQYLIQHHMKLAVTAITRDGSTTTNTTPNTTPNTNTNTPNSKYKYQFCINEHIHIHYKLIMDAEFQVMLQYAVYAYYYRMDISPNVNYNRNMDRLRDLFHVTLTTSSCYEFVVIGKTTQTIPIHYNPSVPIKMVSNSNKKNKYFHNNTTTSGNTTGKRSNNKMDTIEYVPMWDKFSHMEIPDIVLTYACCVPGVHCIPPIEVSIRYRLVLMLRL